MARSARKTSLETRSARARLAARRSPYFVKVAKGLRLGYYRGAGSGTWIGSRYRNQAYETVSLGPADDNVAADNIRVFDYWQAQDALREWSGQQTLIDEGLVRAGPYTVADAVRDYLEETRVEKNAASFRASEITFNALVLPDLGDVQVAKLTTDRLIRWRNANATRPRRLRTKRKASEQAYAAPAGDDHARRARKATANRILSMLKAALNRAFNGGRVPSDSAWRRTKPFAKVDEAVVRYLTVDEARRLVNTCPEDLRRLVQAALLTGCRYSELARLKCADYNPHSQTIAIRLAKGKLRHVTLTAEGTDCFEQWTAGRTGNEIVLLHDDGGVWRKSHQSRPLEEASARAGIVPHVTFHILRHTHGSHLAMKGVPMGVIAAQLGHAGTRMTEKHYAHLAPSYVSQMIRENFPILGIAGPSSIRRLVRTDVG